MAKDNYYITHIILTSLPEEGFDQLFFYTVRDKTLSDGKFYYGCGNNSFGQIFINLLEEDRKILKMNVNDYPFPIKSDETLWIDKIGAIFKANINNPLINQEKICTLEYLINKSNNKD